MHFLIPLKLAGALNFFLKLHAIFRKMNFSANLTLLLSWVISILLKGIKKQNNRQDYAIEGISVVQIHFRGEKG
jgi:hypothetical protein